MKKTTRLSEFFIRAKTPFDGVITRLDIFELRNAIQVTVRFDSDIDIENQKRTLEEEILKHYRLNKVTIIEEVKK